VEEVDLGLPAVSAGAPEGEAARSGDPREQPLSESHRSSNDQPGPRPRRLRWAALLQRVFGLDALRCPRCGATLRLIAAIEDPAIARPASSSALGCPRARLRSSPQLPAMRRSVRVPRSTSPGDSIRRHPRTSRDPRSASRHPCESGHSPTSPRSDLRARIASGVAQPMTRSRRRRHGANRRAGPA
jgi:hypothetical protein